MEWATVHLNHDTMDCIVTQRMGRLAWPRGRVAIQNCIVVERGRLWVAKQRSKAAIQCCDTASAFCDTACYTAGRARGRSLVAI